MNVTLAELRDVLGMISLVIGVFGGLLAAQKAIGEMRRTNRWRRANAATELLKTFFADKVFRDALMMLDWDGRPFDLDGKREPIRHVEVFTALEQSDDVSEKRVFIRTSIDRLLEAFDRLEYSIKMGLIEYEDVKYALEFYVGVLAKEKVVVSDYVARLGFLEVLSFFRRGTVW